jgi:hypothetical protein
MFRLVAPEQSGSRGDRYNCFRRASAKVSSEVDSSMIWCSAKGSKLSGAGGGKSDYNSGTRNGSPAI